MNAPFIIQDDLLQVAFSPGPSSNIDLTPRRMSFADLAELLAKPAVGAKDGSYYIRGGELREPRRNDANLLSAELLIVDGDARIDQDTGEMVNGAPPMEAATAVLDDLGLNYVAHTSHTYIAGELEKWRIVVPCKIKNGSQLDHAYNYMISRLRMAGVHVEPNKESTTWSQAWYRPRVRDKAALATFKYKAKLDGAPLSMSDVEFWYVTREDDEAMEAAIAEAAKAPQGSFDLDLDLDLKPDLDGPKPADRFNAEHGLDWVRAELDRQGYKFEGKRGDNYRYIAKGSTTGKSGVSVFKGTGGDWLVRSYHGSHDPLSHKTFSPFGLYALFHHGGDASKAAKELWKATSGHSSKNSTQDSDETKAAPESPEAIWNPWAEPYTPPFPVDVLPPAVARYVEARGIETGACRSAIAMSCLAAASGAITHEAKLYLKPGKNFPVAPRLWVVLVGNPSAKKSPVMDGAIAPLLKAQKVLQAAQFERWRQEQETEGGKKRERPELTHYVLSDLTPEAFVDVVSRQNRGALLAPDELAGWIGALERYGGKGAASARAIWLNAYTGGYYNLQRIGRETVPVENLSASILGGIQPERLRELGNLTSDGLLQRFLAVWMSKPVLDRNDFAQDAWKGWADTMRDLLEFGRFSTELSPEAQAERERLRETLFDLGQVESEGTAWQGFVGKLPGVWGSLALILHCLWGYRAADPVHADTAARTSRVLMDFILPHGLAFYRHLYGAGEDDNRHIAGFLAGWEGSQVKVRDVKMGPRCCRGMSPEEINKKLRPFEAGGWLEPKEQGPWNRQWTVTPRLAERFSAQLARHRAAIALIQDKIRGADDDEK